MPYAAETDLDAKWGAENVTLAAWNDALTPPGRDEARVAAALGTAASIVDGYLAKRYALPVAATASANALLVALNCDLAMGQLANTPATRNEIVADAEKRATAFLRDLGRGDAAIDLVPPGCDPYPPSPGEAVVVPHASWDGPGAGCGDLSFRDGWRAL